MTFVADVRPIVADASIAVDVVLLEPGAVAAWDRWAEELRLILAPPIVWPEIGSALLRLRLSPAHIAVRLERLEALGLQTADRGRRGVADALELAEAHGLSVYDATYLWLAIDVEGELATRDKALVRAAVAEGVALALEP